jgi:hypothetical protein
MSSSWVGKKVNVYNGLVNSMTDVTQRGLQLIATGTLTAVNFSGNYGTVNGKQYLTENMLLANGGRRKTKKSKRAGKKRKTTRKH